MRGLGQARHSAPESGWSIPGRIPARSRSHWVARWVDAVPGVVAHALVTVPARVISRLHNLTLRRQNYTRGLLPAEAVVGLTPHAVCGLLLLAFGFLSAPRRPGQPAQLTFTGSVCALVLLKNVRRDPAPVGDLKALLPGPRPDRRLVMPPTARARSAAARARNTPRGLDVRADCVGELICMRLAQINLVADAIEAEVHRTRGLAAIDVVNEQDSRLLRHLVSHHF